MYDVRIRDSLQQLVNVGVRFSMDRDQVPFALLSMQFKTSEVAKVFFERAIHFRENHVDIMEMTFIRAGTCVSLNNKSIHLYVIRDAGTEGGTIRGRASRLLEGIEKYLERYSTTVPTDIQPGVFPMPDFCFNLDGYINPEIRQILNRTSKVTAERWFDPNRVAFTKITVEFQLEEDAKTLCEKVVPFWRPFCEVVRNSPQTKNRVEFYTTEEEPDNPNLHGRALRLLRQIEKHSSVSTIVFPGLRHNA